MDFKIMPMRFFLGSVISLLLNVNLSFAQIERLHSENEDLNILSPHSLAKSAQANRNLMKAFFLCNCLSETSPVDSSANADLSSSLYFELLGNYSYASCDTLLGYANNYASKILKSKNDYKYAFTSCMEAYNSLELKKFIASLDSGLYISRRKKKHLYHQKSKISKTAK